MFFKKKDVEKIYILKRQSSHMTDYGSTCSSNYIIGVYSSYEKAKGVLIKLAEKTDGMVLDKERTDDHVTIRNYDGAVLSSISYDIVGIEVN